MTRTRPIIRTLARVLAGGAALAALATVAHAAPPAWEVVDDDSRIVLFPTVHLLQEGLDWQTDKLAAEIEGAEFPDEFVLFHGHLDSWHVGIGDNATGDATLLELARVFWNHRDNLKRTLRVAWWSGQGWKSVRTNCCSRLAKAVLASSIWPSRVDRCEDGWHSRSSSQAWIPKR